MKNEVFFYKLGLKMRVLYKIGQKRGVFYNMVYREIAKNRDPWGGGSSIYLWREGQTDFLSYFVIYAKGTFLWFTPRRHFLVYTKETFL